MVGRVELLTPAKEREIETALAQLADQRSTIRQSGQTTLARLGRFREPALHRILALTKSEQVRSQAASLLKTIARQ
jgi:hypothetical protein